MNLRLLNINHFNWGWWEVNPGSSSRQGGNYVYSLAALCGIQMRVLVAVITCARCHSYFTTTTPRSAEPGSAALALLGFPSIFQPASFPCLPSRFPENKTLFNAGFTPLMLHYLLCYDATSWPRVNVWLEMFVVCRHTH